MKLISWNVNGIRAISKKNLLIALSDKNINFINWIKTSSADIVCVQEIKSDLNLIPQELKEIEGYYFYSHSAEKKGYSGVAIWSKEKPLSIENSISKSKFDIEGRVIRAEFKKFVLFNVYFPNGGASQDRLQYKLDFYDYFTSYLKKIKDKPIVICGDFNTAHFEIDLARPKENEKNTGFMPIEREKLDILNKAGFIDTFRHFNKDGGNYTWWDYKTGARQRNVGWRLDYFFISKTAIKDLKSSSICNDIFGSDHCPISIDIF
jgi:exodeoxyribonuclease-3